MRFRLRWWRVRVLICECGHPDTIHMGLTGRCLKAAPHPRHDNEGLWADDCQEFRKVTR